MSQAMRRRFGRARVAPVLVASLATLAGLLAPAAARAQHFPTDPDLRLLLRYIVEDGEAPAAALGVLEPDGTVRAVAYGDAGAGAHPLGPGSTFQLGDLTMPFTATLLADMVARGEVALDDPVAKYLPDSVAVHAPGGRPITLEQLARHTSGLPAEPPAPVGRFTVDDLYAFLARYEPRHAPGSHREPSTLGYGLLGLALGRAAGMPFPALLRERILEPLGMTHTGYGAGADAEAGGRAGEWAVAGHRNGHVVAPTIPTAALQGGTGLRSSAEDMARFLRANAGLPDTPLRKAMAVTREVWTPYDPEGEGWGWSWRTYASPRGQHIVTHGGRTSGSTALLSFDPVQGIGTVLLASDAAFNDWAARDLLFFRAPADVTPDSSGPPDPEVLARYVGAYGGRGGRYRINFNTGSLFIRLEDDGTLSYQPRGNVRTPLFPVSDSVFYMIRAPLTVSFQHIGDAMRMSVVVDGRQPPSMGQTWTSWRVSDETPPPEVVAGNAPPWSAWPTGVWLLIGLAATAATLLVLRPLCRRRR